MDQLQFFRFPASFDIRGSSEYKPSSLFGQFNDDRIASVAATLDRKLEDLVKIAIR